ncbi:MAG: DegQ family serine endoprotease [Desulfobacterota bacterium]|nr:DegQ family serine endoprotease [Thermodesulfobacteriota bacterium]
MNKSSLIRQQTEPRKSLLFVVVILIAFSACCMLPQRCIAFTDDGSVPTLTVPNFTSLAKKLMPVTVNISTTKIIKPRRRPMTPFESPFGDQDPFRDFFGDDFFRHFFGDIPNRAYKQQSLGSGFIIDSEGYILTNNHVVADADEIKVTLYNKKEYAANVVGRDEKTDIALIKIKEPNGDLPVARLGDSDSLEIGEWVIAIGNPFGLQGTITQGIVSAKWRRIGAGPYDDFIQTDASINPGNSGGPLFNLRGEVVGINTMIYSPSGGNVGIGFAIPINLARSVVTQLKERGRVVRGWLGVVVQKVTPELAESFGLKEGYGALVADVDREGPAAQAGIENGDIIIEFDGKEIREMEDLPLRVAETPVGKKVDVVVLRNGKKKTVTVKIGEMKDRQEQVASAAGEERDLGITVQNITPEMAQRYGLPRKEGVIISQIESGSPAEEAGLRPGDIIQEINRIPVKNTADYAAALRKVKPGDNILFLIRRGASSLWLVVRQPR